MGNTDTDLVARLQDNFPHDLRRLVIGFRHCPIYQLILCTVAFCNLSDRLFDIQRLQNRVQPVSGFRGCM